MVTAYTYFVAHGKSDERRWARLAARHAGVEHIEHVYDRPTRRSSPPRNGGVRRAAAGRRRSRARGSNYALPTRPYSAVFSGDGGDSTFAAEAIVTLVDDFLRIRAFHF